LNAEFKGYFCYNNFENGDAPFDFQTFTDAPSSTVPAVQYDNTSTTFGYDHVIVLTSGSTLVTSHTGIATRPLGPITPGGLGAWFETALTPSTVPVPSTTSTAQSIFAGWATNAALTFSTGSTGGTGALSTDGVVPGYIYGASTGVIRSTGSTAALTILTSTGAYIGFYSHGDTPGNMDAVYANSTGVATVVLANVLTSSTANPNPAFLTFQPNVAPGIFQTSTCYKLGLEYVPVNNTVTWYVNGFPVCSAQVTAALWDVANDYAGVVEIGGSTNALKVDFLAAASQRVL
jgi:hypothetical protein